MGRGETLAPDVGHGAIDRNKLDKLDAEQLRELTRALLTRRDREITWRDAKIDQLTFELAQLRRLKLDRSSEQMSAEQRALFDEAVDGDTAASNWQPCRARSRRSPRVKEKTQARSITRSAAAARCEPRARFVNLESMAGQLAPDYDYMQSFREEIARLKALHFAPERIKTKTEQLARDMNASSLTHPATCEVSAGLWPRGRPPCLTATTLSVEGVQTARPRRRKRITAAACPAKRRPPAGTNGRAAKS